MELEQAISVLSKTGMLMIIMLVFILISILLMGLIAIVFIKAGRWIITRIEMVWKESKESILENHIVNLSTIQSAKNIKRLETEQC